MTNAQGFQQFQQDHVPPTPSNRQAATVPSVHLLGHRVRPEHPEDQQTPRALTSVSGPTCPPSLQGSPLTAAQMSTRSMTSTKLTSVLQLTPHSTPALTPGHILTPQARLRVMTCGSGPFAPSNRQAATGLSACLWRHGVRPVHLNYQRTPRSPTIQGQEASPPKFSLAAMVQGPASAVLSDT